MTLVERAQSVDSREDLAQFIAAVAADLSANFADWENADLPSFLQALAAWTQNMESYYRNSGREIGEQSPWRIVADMLMAARIYE